MKKQPLSQQIEQEIQKQLAEVDQRVDRHGLWFYLVIVMAVCFVVIYLIMNLSPSTQTPMSYDDQISQLESRVDHLESQLNRIESTP